MPHYDLVIVGAGSGNSLIGPEMDDWKIAIVEKDAFGGTCLNRGCIPTKMLIHPADLAHEARHSDRFGVHSSVQSVDWPVIVERVFGRIDPIAAGGEKYRRSLDNVTVYDGEGHFVGMKEMEVDGERFTADRFVLAAGARSMIPSVPGLDPALGPVVPFHTSDDVMRLPTFPQRIVILGGGFIAAEMAHMFGGLGAKVVVINRGERLLKHEDHDISQRFTEIASERYTVVTGAHLDSVTTTDEGIAVHVTQQGTKRTFAGDVVLVATGRIPNGALLEPDQTRLHMDPSGAIPVNDYGQTNIDGIWALGDLNGRHQLKHMANGEARVVAHNLLQPHDLHTFESRPAPHAVFTNPQIGSVGITEDEAKASGRPYVSITHDYGGAAWGWALEDTTSFAKLIGDPATGLLLGAHIIGSHSATLVSLLVQGMYLGNTIEQMAHDVVYIHPAPSEVVEQALLKLLEAMAESTPETDGDLGLRS
jgi:mycothione reductase